MISLSVDPNTGNIVDGNLQLSTSNIIQAAAPMYHDCSKTKFSMVAGEADSFRMNGVSTHYASSLQINTGGVLDTATHNGSVVRSSADVKDNTLVTVGGIQMTAKDAAAQGFINRSADGSYSEGSKKNDVAPQQQQQPQPEADPDPYTPDLADHDVEQALDRVANHLGSYDRLDRVALSAISGLSRGNLEAASKSLAQQTGLEFADATDFVDEVYVNLESKSIDYLTKKHGINGKEAVAFAARSYTPDQKANIFQSVYYGRKSALDDLAVKYKKAVGIANSKKVK